MKINFFKDGKLPGKGTAAVICFCLAAVAALGIFSYNKAADELKSELSGVSDGSETQTSAEAEEAGAAADNVPFTQANAVNEDVILEHDALGGSGAQTETSENSDNAATETDRPQIQFTDNGLTDAVVKPVSGDILNSYSNGELVKSKTLSVWKTHNGIDIAAESGESVKSITSGTVVSVERDTMMGITVVIDHGSGYEGYYCSLSPETSVSAGDEVSAGTVIGTVGNTAEEEISEPSHLHFGLKHNGVWTDPAKVLSGEGS